MVKKASKLMDHITKSKNISAIAHRNSFAGRPSHFSQLNLILMGMSCFCLSIITILVDDTDNLKIFFRNC